MIDDWFEVASRRHFSKPHGLKLILQSPMPRPAGHERRVTMTFAIYDVRFSIFVFVCRWLSIVSGPGSKGPSTLGWGCAFVSNFLVFFGVGTVVSACGTRGKKILRFWDFPHWVPVHLIDFFRFLRVEAGGFSRKSLIVRDGWGIVLGS